MTVEDVARELVELCREGRFLDAIERCYASDVVSVEPFDHGPDMPARVEGVEAVKAKNRMWLENSVSHGLRLDGPFLGDGGFAVRFHMDVTMKSTGQRVQAVEMALYTVEDGKIVLEEFYYAPAL